MKAREYLEKHIDKIKKENEDDVATYALSIRILDEFHHEMVEITQKRGIKTIGEMLDVIDSQNQKWNALERRIEQSGFAPVLKKNGFRDAMLKMIQEESEAQQAAREG